MDYVLEVSFCLCCRFFSSACAAAWMAMCSSRRSVPTWGHAGANPGVGFGKTRGAEVSRFLTDSSRWADASSSVSSHTAPKKICPLSSNRKTLASAIGTAYSMYWQGNR
ncbi:hypothetical protein HBI07_234650 [Parastagonospora nodorum]|nr:hypothetical protein HBI74_133740 [Parastagonospora nodorum]KAH6519274.1 hypothetical protein HBI07_234650 [Parastagonospora nodorum]